MCKKQTSVSHSSTESEKISLDAGLSMDGIPALDLWDVVIEVLHSSDSRTATTKMNSANEGRVKELLETAARQTQTGVSSVERRQTVSKELRKTAAR